MADDAESYFKKLGEKTEPVRQAIASAGKPKVQADTKKPVAKADEDAKTETAYTVYNDEDKKYMEGRLQAINKKLTPRALEDNPGGFMERKEWNVKRRIKTPRTNERSNGR